MSVRQWIRFITGILVAFSGAQEGCVCIDTYKLNHVHHHE